jgi:RNA polymerase sigma-70 factor (sigma-E family)
MKRETRDQEFRAYVTQNRGGLLRAATLLASGDSHRAEDLVQTVLIRIYLAWPRIRQETLNAYARRALVNAHLDDRRRPHSRYERAHAEPPEIAVEESGTTEIEAALFRALNELPPGMRAAVVLRHVCEVSVAEAADALGCSEGTVKSQTARGLGQLRTALREPTRDGETDRATDLNVVAMKGRGHE